MQQPRLFIIAGCNGAGKTTASYSLLPDLLKIKEFVNADEIAKGLSPLNQDSAKIQAGRLMLSRIDFLLNKKADFAFETTLATKSFKKTIEKATDLGYEVTLLFLWLNKVELAISRVQNRVIQGGHDIPKDIITRRYHAGLKNLFKIYLPLVDKASLIDASFEKLTTIAKFEDNTTFIKEVELFKIIQEKYA